MKESVWVKYLGRLRKLNDKAAQLVTAYLIEHPVMTYEDRQALITYASAVTLKYGNGSAALAAEMYDAIAELSGAHVKAAVPAEIATVAEVARSINGTLKYGDANLVGGSIGRLVKMAGVDTTLKNAIRDRAQFAWVPHGDTCAFCIALASKGWQIASEEALNGNHAEHVHANCDCTYAVKFSDKDNYGFYNPAEYSEMYDDAGGINELRRDMYAKNAVKIRAQKRAAYARKTEKDKVE